MSKMFDITDEGSTIEEYLGLKTDHKYDGSFRMYQPHLLERIIKVIPGMDRTNEHKTPAATTTILTKDIDGEVRKEDWNYRAMVGVLNFIVGSTMPDIAHATHQCARFCESPKASHERAVKQVVRHLISAKNSREYGLIMKPDKNKGLDVYVDASFAGDWNQSWSEEPTSTEITLSTTESEYIALSQAMREAIPLTELLNKIRACIRVSEDRKAEFKCT
eukprot:12019956-Ditylum_brightwellii.AAC.1